ncbi:hypothetical protein ACFC5Z_28925 [Streptomyces sp. NPDC056004]|uniref:hypothetical protein n=1 Tax=unclassified Streptomyces TaxID=2593676 RepID=UPI0035DDEE3D
MANCHSQPLVAAGCGLTTVSRSPASAAPTGVRILGVRGGPGDHTIAERAFREDAPAVLHTPLPSLIYADRDGDTKLAVDQPSLLFYSYGNPQIAEVGRELDARLAQLIALLGGDVPPQL